MKLSRARISKLLKIGIQSRKKKIHKTFDNNKQKKEENKFQLNEILILDTNNKVDRSRQAITRSLHNIKPPPPPLKKPRTVRGGKPPINLRLKTVRKPAWNKKQFSPPHNKPKNRQQYGGKEPSGAQYKYVKALLGFKDSLKAGPVSTDFFDFVNDDSKLKKINQLNNDLTAGKLKSNFDDFKTAVETIKQSLSSLNSVAELQKKYDDALKKQEDDITTVKDNYKVNQTQTTSEQQLASQIAQIKTDNQTLISQAKQELDTAKTPTGTGTAAASAYQLDDETITKIHAAIDKAISVPITISLISTATAKTGSINLNSTLDVLISAIKTLRDEEGKLIYEPAIHELQFKNNSSSSSNIFENISDRKIIINNRLISNPKLYEYEIGDNNTLQIDEKNISVTVKYKEQTENISNNKITDTLDKVLKKNGTFKFEYTKHNLKINGTEYKCTSSVQSGGNAPKNEYLELSNNSSNNREFNNPNYAVNTDQNESSYTNINQYGNLLYKPAAIIAPAAIDKCSTKTLAELHIKDKDTIEIVDNATAIEENKKYIIKITDKEGNYDDTTAQVKIQTDILQTTTNRDIIWPELDTYYYTYNNQLLDTNNDTMALKEIFKKIDIDIATLNEPEPADSSKILIKVQQRTPGYWLLHRLLHGDLFYLIDVKSIGRIVQMMINAPGKLNGGILGIKSFNEKFKDPLSTTLGQGQTSTLDNHNWHKELEDLYIMKNKDEDFSGGGGSVANLIDFFNLPLLAEFLKVKPYYTIPDIDTIIKTRIELHNSFADKDEATAEIVRRYKNKNIMQKITWAFKNVNVQDYKSSQKINYITKFTINAWQDAPSISSADEDNFTKDKISLTKLCQAYINNFAPLVKGGGRDPKTGVFYALGKTLHDTWTTTKYITAHMEYTEQKLSDVTNQDFNKTKQLYNGYRLIKASSLRKMMKTTSRSDLFGQFLRDGTNFDRIAEILAYTYQKIRPLANQYNNIVARENKGPLPETANGQIDQIIELVKGIKQQAESLSGEDTEIKTVADADQETIRAQNQADDEATEPGANQIAGKGAEPNAGKGQGAEPGADPNADPNLINQLNDNKIGGAADAETIDDIALDIATIKSLTDLIRANEILKKNVNIKIALKKVDSNIKTLQSEITDSHKLLANSTALLAACEALRDLIDKLIPRTDQKNTDLAAALSANQPAADSSSSSAAAATSELQKQIDQLREQLAKMEVSRGENKITEDEAAIRAIMTGEDAFSHKLKLLVDIPKWQQFSVIGDTDGSVEEFAKGAITGLNKKNFNDSVSKINDLMKQHGNDISQLITFINTKVQDAIKEPSHKPEVVEMLKTLFKQVIKDKTDMAEELAKYELEQATALGRPPPPPNPKIEELKSGTELLNTWITDLLKGPPPPDGAKNNEGADKNVKKDEANNIKLRELETKKQILDEELKKNPTNKIKQDEQKLLADEIAKLTAENKTLQTIKLGTDDKPIAENANKTTPGGKNNKNTKSRGGGGKKNKKIRSRRKMKGGEESKLPPPPENSGGPVNKDNVIAEFSIDPSLLKLINSEKGNDVNLAPNIQISGGTASVVSLGVRDFSLIQTFLGHNPDAVGEKPLDDGNPDAAAKNPADAAAGNPAGADTEKPAGADTEKPAGAEKSSTGGSGAHKQHRRARKTKKNRRGKKTNNKRSNKYVRK